jgi:hypothetical protein
MEKEKEKTYFIEYYECVYNWVRRYSKITTDKIPHKQNLNVILKENPPQILWTKDTAFKKEHRCYDFETDLKIKEANNE